MSERTQQFEVLRPCPGFEWPNHLIARLPAAVWVYADQPTICSGCNQLSYVIADCEVRFVDGSTGFISRPPEYEKLFTELVACGSRPGACLSMGRLIE